MKMFRGVAGTIPFIVLSFGFFEVEPMYGDISDPALEMGGHVCVKQNLTLADTLIDVTIDEDIEVYQSVDLAGRVPDGSFMVYISVHSKYYNDVISDNFHVEVRMAGLETSKRILKTEGLGRQDNATDNTGYYWLPVNTDNPMLEYRAISIREGCSARVILVLQGYFAR